jgi:cell division protein FtsQ
MTTTATRDRAAKAAKAAKAKAAVAAKAAAAKAATTKAAKDRTAAETGAVAKGAPAERPAAEHRTATRDGAGATPSRIDPRMRARRVAVLRGEGRRRLRRLLAVLVVAVTCGLAYLATRSPLLDVDRVNTHGLVHTDAADVLAASGIERGVAMTDVDSGDAETAIAALPWVDSVRVERDWPGTIEIHVTEREPTATLLGASGEWFLVDDTGRVLDRADGPAPERPTIVAGAAVVTPGATQPGIGDALAVVRLLTPDLQAWVQAVQPGPDGTVDLLLHGDVRVELGSTAHLDDKIVDLATVLTRVDLTDLQSIDVSVVHTPVVTRR